MEDNHEPLTPLTEAESNEMWKTVISRIRLQEQRKRKNKAIRLASSFAIAAILILGGIFIYENYANLDVYYANTVEKTVILKDSTQITLQPGAKLTVERNFPAETRDVYLNGDAIFRVSKSKDHPFIVHTSAYDTKVLGTVFKITQRGQEFNVDLFEGKVQINKNGSPKDIFELRPQESFSNMGSPKIGTVVSTGKMIAAGRSDIATVSFNDLTLSEAAKIFKQTYGTEFIVPKNYENTKISVTKERATAQELIQQISIQINLNTKKINDRTFKLEE